MGFGEVEDALAGAGVRFVLSRFFLFGRSQQQRDVKEVLREGDRQNLAEGEEGPEVWDLALAAFGPHVDYC